MSCIKFENTNVFIYLRRNSGTIDKTLKSLEVHCTKIFHI